MLVILCMNIFNREINHDEIYLSLKKNIDYDSFKGKI